MITTVKCVECGEELQYSQTSPLPPGMGVLHGDCFDRRMARIRAQQEDTE